jgi:vacuolar-type H+-ATPase subunit I/STV1
MAAPTEILIINLNIMDLNQKKEELLKEIEQFEKTKKEAHEEILKLKAKLRKLALVSRDAEELFNNDK